MLARPAISLPVRWRRWCVFALLLIALGIARGAMLDGIWTPVRITGPSMAPTLTGEQTLLDCQACRFPIMFDATAPASRIVCPNCGHMQTDDHPLRTIAGERVLIDGWPLWWRSPQRMELVAWETDAGLAVKRIVGLPGEHLAIRDGELYRNGQLWQKTLAEQRALSQRVHDDRYSASAASPWQSEPAKAARFDAFEATHTLSATTGVAWLNFHPPALQLVPSAAQRARITDIDLYNPATSRTINDVFDVRITGRIELDTSGLVIWRLHDGWYEWRIEWNHTQQALALFQDESKVAFRSAKVAGLPSSTSAKNATFAERKATDGQAFDFEVAVCDQQVIVVIDGQTRLQHAYAPPATSRQPSETVAISIGIAQGAAKVKQLRVDRDIYWLDPPGLNRPWQPAAPLKENEYFLLGDNVPVSTDSRHEGPVPRSRLRGIVRPWQ